MSPPQRTESAKPSGGRGAISRSNFPIRLPRRAITHLAVLGLLILLLSAFFWQLTVLHRVLSPADLVFISYPWSTQAPAEFQHPENAFQSDDAFLFYPRRSALFNDGTAGISWWQEDYLAGARNTFSVDFLGLVFYPPAWAYYLLPFHIANGVFHAGVLLVAGLSMYLLLRQLRLPGMAAFYGGVLYMLNGHFIVWLGAAFLAAILGLIPLMIFGFERYRERRQPFYLLIPAVGLAMQIYLGYAPGWVVTGGVLSIYGLVRLAPTVWGRQYGASLRQTGVYVASAGLGVLLAAYALLPTLTAALASDYQTGRQSGLGSNLLENAWTYLFPNYWGTPEAPVWLYPGGNYPEWIAYFGITAAPLALLGLWELRRSWVAWFAVGVLALSVSQMYGIPPLKSLAHLPGFQQTGAARWHFGVPLAVSLLAPLGMAFLLRSNAPARTRRLLSVAIAVALLIAFMAVALLGTSRGDTPMLQFITEGRGLVLHPSDFLDQLKSSFTHLHRQLLFLLGGGALTILALLVRQRWTLLLPPALVVITMVDLFSFGSSYNATVKKADLYPDTPGLVFLQGDDDLFRIAPVAGGGLGLLPGYTANLFGLQTITGYDHYRDQEYLAFLGPMLSTFDVTFANASGYVGIASDQRPLNRNLLALLNVRYVVSPPSGLLFAESTQLEQEIAYPIYGTLRQGQTVALQHQRADRVELLLATGGGPGPSSPVIFRFKRGPDDDQDVYTYTVDGSQLQDNAWFSIDLPPEQAFTGRQLYLEIEAPEITAEDPIYVWGLQGSGPPGSRRLESGAPAGGSLTFRVLYRPEELGLTPVYQGEDLAIYRLETSLPRAWGVGQAEVLPTREAALARIASEDFDPTSAVVFAAEDLQDDLVQAGASAGGTFRAWLLDYGSDALTVGTDFSQPGFLVLSERFDEGWRAKVDGSDAPVLRANGILRAVPVGPGQHTIHLSFRPWEYVWGARISLSAVALTGLGLALYLGFSARKRFALLARKDTP